MKLRHPIIIRGAAWIIALVIRAWLRTLRYQVASCDLRRHPTDPRSERNIYAFWHESLLVLVLAGRTTDIRVLISKHADGELIARVCRHLGIGTIRGSTTRGGGPALLEMLRSGRRSHLGVTPDGPRGPRRRVQLGVVFLASATGLPIVPVGVGYTAAWRAGSWDRFAVPIPGSKVTAVVGRTIHVPEKLNRSELEQFREKVEQRLLEATDLAERWAEDPSEPPPLYRDRRPDRSYVLYDQRKSA